jgi:hypothetical protein
MSTPVGSSTPSTTPRFALPGHASDLAGQAPATTATRSAARPADTSPESTPARSTPLSRESFGIPLNPQAAQLARATDRPAAPAVPEKSVLQFQARNAKAVAALQAQLKELGQVQGKIDALGSQGLTAPSRARLAELTQAVAGKRQGIEAELGLRETAAARIDQSTQPKGRLHQDTAVAQALGALADHAKGPGLTPKDVAGFNAVLDKKVHTEAKYDKPQYLTYGSQGGPGYPKREDADTRYSLGSSPAWSDLTQGKQVTPSEQKVISRMSGNEGGRTDALQGYDSEIVSLGAMQKTVNAKGIGELPLQIHGFSQTHPDKYKALFADKGWTVEHTGKGTTNDDYTLSFKDPADPKATRMTGAELKAYIHQRNPEAWNKTLPPLLAAGRDVDFQKTQILDYQARLDSALGKVPTGQGKYTQPISAYLTSERGVALVLDQDVNRPAYVRADVGKALDAFHAAHPQAPKDPARWTAAQRQQYEPAIAAQYEVARVGRMTDAEDRAAHLTGPASGLSAAPGSFVRTP